MMTPTPATSQGRLRRLAIGLLPVGAGILAGALTSVLISRQAASGGPPGEKGGAEALPPAGGMRAPPVPRSRSGQDTRALARRLSAAEHKIANLSSQANAPGDRPEGAPEPAERGEREEQMRRGLEDFRAEVERHLGERVDPAWANATSTSLEAELASLTGPGGRPAGGQLTGVDCRTSSCLAIVEFPSYGAARESYGAYVTSLYEVNCARTTMLDVPEDPSLPYKVELLFERCQRD